MSESSPLPDIGVGLDDLIEVVNGAHPEEDELVRLSTAVLISERLGEVGDHLIGHFVDQARHAGATWTAIGSSMGVTKQAAQKRFVPGAGDVSRDQLFNRFTPRARRSLETARTEARRMKNAQVGTEHLVLGLMAEKGGIAATVMEAQGVTVATLRRKVTGAGVPKVEEAPEQTPFAPDAKQVLKMAFREALRRGHNYIGTEHLLLGVLADDGSVGSQVLLGLGVTEAATNDRITAALAEFTPTEG